MEPFWIRIFHTLPEECLQPASHFWLYLPCLFITVNGKLYRHRRRTFTFQAGNDDGGCVHHRAVEEGGFPPPGLSYPCSQGESQLFFPHVGGSQVFLKGL